MEGAQKPEGQRHELSDVEPVELAEVKESDSDLNIDDDTISGVTSRSSQSPQRTRMASKLSEPTADELAMISEMMKAMKMESERQAVIDALKKYQSDPEVKDEVEKLTAKLEEQQAKEDGKGNWQREPKTASKFVQNIPKFGVNDKVTWPELVSHLEMVQETGIYSDTELKIMLFGAFEGPASEYVRAHKEIFQQSFSRAMAILEKVFGKTTSQNVHDLSNIQQLPNEKVDFFEGRLINAAGKLKPERPQFIRREYDEAKKEWKTVPNDDYKRELYRYEGECRILEKLMLQQFLNGLRQDIKRQIKIDAAMYTELSEAVKAAKMVEQFLDFQLGMVNAVTTSKDDKEETNAVYNSGKGRGRGRGRGRGQYIKDMESQAVPGSGAKPKRGGFNIQNARCYRCNRFGHFSRDCTQTIVKYVKSRSPSPNQGAMGTSYPGKSGFKRKTVFRQARNPRRGDPNCQKCRQLKRSCSRHRRNSQNKKQQYVNQVETEPEDEEEEEYEDEEVYEEYVDYEDSKN